MVVTVIKKGGPGSGNFGHSGRPGKVGGSSPGKGGNKHKDYRQFVAMVNDKRYNDLDKSIGFGQQANSRLIKLDDGTLAIRKEYFEPLHEELEGMARNDAAAYEISQLIGIDGVPMTAMESENVSIQEFVENSNEVSDYIDQLDDVVMPTLDDRQVKDLLYLDVILGSSDRNSTNLLMHKNTGRLSFIDNSNTLAAGWGKMDTSSDYEDIVRLIKSDIKQSLNYEGDIKVYKSEWAEISTKVRSPAMKSIITKYYGVDSDVIYDGMIGRIKAFDELYITNLKRKIIITKGGPGSGHFGHAGRPGKVGGSASGKRVVQHQREQGYGNKVDDYNQLKGLSENPEDSTPSYIIGPDKKLYDTYNTDHNIGADSYFDAHMDEYDALQDKYSTELTKLYPSLNISTLDALLELGGVRVRRFYNNLYIHTGDRNPKTLRKLHKYIDDNLLNMSGVKFISWDTSGFGMDSTTITTSLREFLNAKSVYKLGDDTLVYREKRIVITKGGKGSGNFGHSGRPGKVGGSSPGKGGKGKTRGRVIEEIAVRYPIWRNRPNTLNVRDDGNIPNVSSVSASLDNWDELPGIREVHMNEFEGVTGRSYSVKGNKAIKNLADAIRSSGEITPLIVVIDIEGSYILEGSTRIDALKRLGVNEFPALVIIEKSLRKKIIVTKGGKGSGNFGHSGRPGKVGGSAPGKGGNGSWKTSEAEEQALRFGMRPNYERDYNESWGKEPGTYTAYRATLDPNQLTARGAYFAPQKIDAEPYVFPGSESAVHKYKITIENPFVAKTKSDATLLLFDSKHIPMLEKIAYEHGIDNLTANRELDRMIMEGLSKLGYDSMTLTIPQPPATREIVIFEEGLFTVEKSKRIRVITKLKQQDYSGTAWIFLMADNPEIKSLWEEFGSDEDVSPLHITLLYLGDIDNILLNKEEIVNILESFAGGQAPIEGVYNGSAMFKDNGDGYPHVLLFDSPQLPGAFNRLATLLILHRPELTHGFTPHTTLAYLDHLGGLPKDVNIKHTFNEMVLKWGDEEQVFSFDSTIVEKSKRIRVIKGSTTSGHYGHEGRPGKVGGSAPKGGGKAVPEMSGEQKLAWRMAINIGMYDRLQKVEHGDLLLRAIENVAWGSDKDEFLSRFQETEEPALEAKYEVSDNYKWRPEHVMWAISKYTRENKGATAIEVDRLAELAGIPPYKVEKYYESYFQRYFQAEYQANLRQWRIRGTKFQFDSRKGIITTSGALNKALKSARFKSPEALYDAALKLLPKIKQSKRIIITKGGPGSGHFGHAGRPGKVGGSASGKGGVGTGENAIREQLNLYASFRKGRKPEGAKYGSPEELVLEVGRYYESSNEPLPKGVSAGELKQCYMNTLRNMRSDLIYTEGYGMVEGLPMIFNHAWLTTKDGKVVDLTWRDNAPIAYFGIPFNADFVFATTTRTEMAGILVNDWMDDSRILMHGLPDDAIYEEVLKHIRVIKGGPGSGHFGHAGRPGKIGGSAPGKGFKGKMANPNGKDTMEQYRNADGSWTAERQSLHDKITAKFFYGATPVDDPTSYVLGGGPAAGKTTVMRQGLEDLPENIVSASGDDIKAMLPEYIGGSNAEFVHEESSYLSKEIAYKAANQSYNVIMDGTGDNTIESLTRKVNSMRPLGQDVIGVYITVNIDTAIKRSLARAKSTGRYVPESVLRHTHRMVANIYPAIINADIYTNVNLYDTSVGVPKLIAREIGKDFTVLDDEAYQRFLNRGK